MLLVVMQRRRNLLQAIQAGIVGFITFLANVYAWTGRIQLQVPECRSTLFRNAQVMSVHAVPLDSVFGLNSEMSQRQALKPQQEKDKTARKVLLNMKLADKVSFKVGMRAGECTGISIDI